MQQKEQNKKENKFKAFFKGLIDKLDKKMLKQCKTKSSCCTENDSKEQACCK